MSLEVRCFVCGRELDEPGALLFGPPDRIGRTLKRHFCNRCYTLLEDDIEDMHERLDLVLSAAQIRERMRARQH